MRFIGASHLGQLLSILSFLLLTERCSTFQGSTTAFVSQQISRTRQQSTVVIRLIPEDRIDSASAKLIWETLEETSKSPVLNLSDRNEPISTNSSDDPSTIMDINTMTLDISEWSQGQRWKCTQEELSKSNINISIEFMQDACPQLFRLPTELVVETAHFFLAQKFTAGYIESEPKLLSFRQSDVEYGIGFLETMMMLKLISGDTSEAAPHILENYPSSLLLGGIEGGIQERAVQTALGSAADATSQANQRIVGNVKSSLDEVKRIKGL